MDRGGDDPVTVRARGGLRTVARGALVALALVWLLLAVILSSLAESFNYRPDSPAALPLMWLTAGLIALGPIVFAVKTGGKRLGLAWLLFIGGAFLFFGLCVAVFE